MWNGSHSALPRLTNNCARCFNSLNLLRVFSQLSWKRRFTCTCQNQEPIELIPLETLCCMQHGQELFFYFYIIYYFCLFVFVFDVFW